MKYNKKILIIVKTCLLMLTCLLISACGQFEKYETVEVYMIETFEDNQNDEGIFETTGYVIGNSITIVKEGKSNINSDVKSIEDFYDVDGNYLRTEISHSNAKKSKMLLTEEGKNLKEELQEPSTILITVQNAKNFNSNDMTSEEKTLVREHVLAMIDKL